MSDLKPPVIMTSDSDVQSFIRKHLLSHWLFKHVDSQFICSNDGYWRPHNTAVVNAETIKKNYTVMADGDGNPLISEHFNCIATQFQIKSCHKETIKILQNFMEHCLARVSDEGKVGENLIQAYQDIRMVKKQKKAKIPVVNTGQPDLVALSS
jgi:hypothetical protein